MALFKSLTFGDVNSMDYEVYITGAGVYNAPERAVEMYAIPGRNGALAIDGGRYENIEVTYTCGCFANTDAEFAEKIRAFRNAICSQYTYRRLTDEYNPDEYRMALYRSGLETEPFRSKAGEFEITFDCKPQRFLTSGESTYQIGEWGQTITQTGDIVTYQGDDLTAVKSLTTDLKPIQDLHGYDSPWVGGAGKNKMPAGEARDVTFNGIRFQSDGKGTYHVSGTKTTESPQNVYFMLEVPFNIPYSTDCTVYFMNTTANNDVVFYFYNDSTSVDSWGLSPANKYSGGYSAMGGKYCDRVMIQVRTNDPVDITLSPMFLLKAETDLTFAPYSNICPIYGRTGQTVTVTGKNLCSGINHYNVNNCMTSAIWLKGSIKYTFSFENAVNADGLYVRSGTTISASAPTIAIVYNAKKITFTAPKDNYYFFQMYKNGNGWTTDPTNGQLEIGETATAYEPYAGTTYTRSFVDDQGNELTVYGGEDEIVGGVLTVTHKMLNLDGNALKSALMNVYMNVNRFAFNFGVGNAPRYNGIDTFCMSDRAEVSYMQTIGGGSSQGVDGVYCYPHTSAIFLSFGINRGIDTRNKCDAWLQENPVQVVYELATPLTYQLTANEVETLIGTNHVWSDAGEVTVEYGTDPYTMVNNTLFDANPLIKVTGYGQVGFGDVTITITGTAGVVTYIDCDLMECYRMSGGAIVPANQYVTFTGTDFPTIPTGKTRVTSASTISKVEVVPRWWIL